MSLLHEIQAAVLQEGADLGPILLRLRLLAARIGSQPLAEWVRHESEGYPRDAELPDFALGTINAALVVAALVLIGAQLYALSAV
jgi:hypothetical protein